MYMFISQVYLRASPVLNLMVIKIMGIYKAHAMIGAQGTTSLTSLFIGRPKRLSKHHLTSLGSMEIALKLVHPVEPRFVSLGSTKPNRAFIVFKSK